jgi:hypothetical protein
MRGGQLLEKELIEKLISSKGVVGGGQHGKGRKHGGMEQ